jgi:hypothetical protein
MIRLAVVVLDELGECPSWMAFSERDHLVEALVLDRAYGGTVAVDDVSFHVQPGKSSV